ncbi:P-loop NTPase family protein [Candidatus Liberibacter brunswickensis]|uniref:DnaA ATPase domain-containing protein n=1 Tax=Candidatus Liberibacter brunswickensis TaxID=1968796 RepID=UPI002FE11143
MDDYNLFISDKRKDGNQIKYNKEEQLFLSFPRHNEINRDDLLVHNSIEHAIRLIDSWPFWPSPVVIIVGPSGSGKSFLSRIWSEKSESTRLDNIDKSLDSILIDTRKPVLLEDVDRLDFNDTQLFHIINNVYQYDSSLMMTARTLPVSWEVCLPDLCSRLQAATVVKISIPDDDCLEKIIVKMFADRQIFVDKRLAAYIVQRMERSFVVAEKLVDRMDNLALSRSIGMTRSLAAEVLKEIQE